MANDLLQKHVDVILVEKNEQYEIKDYVEYVDALGETRRVYLLYDFKNESFKIALDNQLCLADKKHDDTAKYEYHVAVWKLNQAAADNLIVENSIAILGTIGSAIAEMGTKGLNSNFLSISIIKREKKIKCDESTTSELL